MRTVIYYFSGTGNSLHVAKELKKRLEGAELIPIVSLLKIDNYKSDCEIAGFVFPIYLTSLPYPVRQFIENADFSSAKYIFAFLTRAGTFYIAGHLMRKLLIKKGVKLNAFFVQNMVTNSPTGIMPVAGDTSWPLKISAEKTNELEGPLQERLNKAADIIKDKEDYNDRESTFFLTKLLTPLFSAMTKNNSSQIKYLTDNTCTGCGLCEEVCPSDKIILKGNKPLWQQDVICYYCFACFNFCPEQAILVKYYTDKKGRYHHPDVTLKEIADQK